MSAYLFVDIKVVYETPLRIFAALPQNATVEFCDYMFPDETLADSANRFCDFVGIDVSENDIDESAEHVPCKFSACCQLVVTFVSLCIYCFFVNLLYFV